MWKAEDTRATKAFADAVAADGIVALKEMTKLEYLQEEIKARFIGNQSLKPQYVLNMIRAHAPAEKIDELRAWCKKNIPSQDHEQIIAEEPVADGKYVLVLPFGDENLATAMSAKRIAGHKHQEIVSIATAIAEGLHHMHQAFGVCVYIGVFVYIYT